MERIIKKPPYISHSTPSPLAMHKNSHPISKTKPKIRIIHIFAPEIIKTDVENFRELVQRLTGKPTEHDHHHHHQKVGKKRPRNPTREEEPRSTSVLEKPDLVTKNVELRSTFFGFETREKVKEEEEEEQILWNGANSGGFLHGFADFDGFIQELDEFPLLPVDTSHHMLGLI